MVLKTAKMKMTKVDPDLALSNDLGSPRRMPSFIHSRVNVKMC